MAKDDFFVARTAEGAYVRVHGMGNMHNAPTLNAFAEKMMEDGYCRFVLDLGPCRGVDSTFMGTLLGISSRAKENAKKKEEGGLILINVGDRCRNQLSSIGLDAFLTFHETPQKVPDAEFRRLGGKEVSPKERLQLILKAHHDLVAYDKRNESKFGPFLRSILKDI
jgi:anti-sigma B factor antagonist